MAEQESRSFPQEERGKGTVPEVSQVREKLRTKMLRLGLMLA